MTIPLRRCIYEKPFLNQLQRANDPAFLLPALQTRSRTYPRTFYNYSIRLSTLAHARVPPLTTPKKYQEARTQQEAVRRCHRAVKLREPKFKNHATGQG